MKQLRVPRPRSLHRFVVLDCNLDGNGTSISPRCHACIGFICLCLCHPPTIICNSKRDVPIEANYHCGAPHLFLCAAEYGRRYKKGSTDGDRGTIGKYAARMGHPSRVGRVCYLVSMRLVGVIVVLLLRVLVCCHPSAIESSDGLVLKRCSAVPNKFVPRVIRFSA